MERLSDSAIIISARDYRETDRLVRLFTLHHGPLTALARGAKRSVKRFSGALQPFSHLTIELTIRDSGLSILHEAGMPEQPFRLRTDPERFALASYGCELVERFLPDHLPNLRLFRLLRSFLAFLGGEGECHLSSARRFYEINLLSILGYKPDMTQTTFCRTAAAKLDECLTTSRFNGILFAADELVAAGGFLDRTIAAHLDRRLITLDFLESLYVKG